MFGFTFVIEFVRMAERREGRLTLKEQWRSTSKRKIELTASRLSNFVKSLSTVFDGDNVLFIALVLRLNMQLFRVPTDRSTTGLCLNRLSPR